MEIRDGFVGGIGNTPLIRLRAASELTGCNVLLRVEHIGSPSSISTA
jgi:cysteine synthase